MQIQLNVKKGNSNSPGKTEGVCGTLTVTGVSGVVFPLSGLNSESENTLDYHNEVLSGLRECLCVRICTQSFLGAEQIVEVSRKDKSKKKLEC